MGPGSAAHHAARAARCVTSGHVDGRKFLPRRHQLPGSPDRSRCKKPRFCWLFHDGTAFADTSAGKVKGRAMRHLSGFCHADGSWRRIDRTGCAALADVVEIVLSAIDRLQAGSGQSVRCSGERPGFRKFNAAVRARRSFADIAGDHGRAACRAKPDIDGFKHVGLGQPVRLPEGPVLVDRC